MKITGSRGKYAVEHGHPRHDLVLVVGEDACFQAMFVGKQPNGDLVVGRDVRLHRALLQRAVTAVGGAASAPEHLASLDAVDYPPYMNRLERQVAFVKAWQETGRPPAELVSTPTREWNGIRQRVQAPGHLAAGDRWGRMTETQRREIHRADHEQYQAWLRDHEAPF